MEFGCQWALVLGCIISFFHLSLNSSFSNDGRFQARYHTEEMAGYLIGNFAFAVVYLAAVARLQEDIRNFLIGLVADMNMMGNSVCLVDMTSLYFQECIL